MAEPNVATIELGRELVSGLKARHGAPSSDGQTPTVRAAAQRLLLDFLASFECDVRHQALERANEVGPVHLQALQHANEVRLARAQLKRRVAAGEMTVSEVIRDSPWEAAEMTIAELLTSQPRWGATRCNKFLRSIGIPASKTIGSMTDRQRRLLAHPDLAAPHRPFGLT